MAARLMMEFPNAVTCDEVTKHKSRLPEEDFEVQPPVTLKGIASPGEVYAFSTEKCVIYYVNLRTSSIKLGPSHPLN